MYRKSASRIISVSRLQLLMLDSNETDRRGRPSEDSQKLYVSFQTCNRRTIVIFNVYCFIVVAPSVWNSLPQTSVVSPVLTLSTVNSKLFDFREFILNVILVIILFYSPLFIVRRR